MKSTLYAVMIAACAFTLAACKEKTTETAPEAPAATTEAPAPEAPVTAPEATAPATTEAPVEEPKKEEAPAAH